MKNKLFLIIAVVFFACNSTEYKTEDYTEQDVQAAVISAPFSKGVNFSQWFESFSAGSIPFTRYTEQDFKDVKSLGVDVIRLPIRMHSMTSGAPNYTLDTLFLQFLDQAVSWAEKYEIYIIIDNHSFDPVRATSNDIDRVLIPVWEQIARRYRNRSDYVIYEILNEPHGIDDTLWGNIQGRTVEAIRRIDQKHFIIVGGTDYNSIRKLLALPVYADSKLIYTFHFYDPHVFTHQGATWGEPSMGNLSGVPFPYDPKRMPRVPANLIGTWLENAINGYRIAASPTALYNSLDRVVNFSRERNVPVFCGEFGVFMIQSPPADRVKWYEVVSNALDKRNISRASWDYYGGFGVFNSGNGNFNYDLNTEVVRAMGFTPPAQIQRTEEQFNTGFVIFDDYPNRNYVSAGSWGDNVDFSLYDTNQARGQFAIRWANASQYNAFYFSFDASKMDFRYLAENGYYLEFMARVDRPANFDVRFLNTESSSSTPWRIRYTIDQSMIPADRNWHTIRIPLSQMTEHGAWISSTQRWVEPKGEFSWRYIERLEFVAEHSALPGTIWFDEIRITQ
ncbi:MAG: glycoside hydrolase family 5 protein [Treponema sp.]|jgi:endoglucanase|nr:glycoside hydrolase family 5 protein [Treponema sp.]